MSGKKKVLIASGIFFALLQLFQPNRNKNPHVSKNDITLIYQMPGNVKAILQKSCYDCHSNNTRYPWYSRIQPGAWLMARHIKEGKEELNFDEFANYSKRRQLSKLRAIEGSMEDGTMPLASYVFIHRNAKLSAADQERIKIWALNTLDILKNKP